MNLKLAAVSLIVLSSFAHAQTVSSKNVPVQTVRYQVLDEGGESSPLSKRFAIGIDTTMLAISSIGGMAAMPLEAQIKIVGGLSIGPSVTFGMGTYTDQNINYKLSSFGGQLMYSFGSNGAIADGFFVKGFYQRYKINGDTISQVSLDGTGSNTIGIPLEGSVPFDMLGGAVGYQWVYESGFRFTLGVRVVYMRSDSKNITLMGMNASELSAFAAGGDPVQQSVETPFADESAIVPLPELSLGWSF